MKTVCPKCNERQKEPGRGYCAECRKKYQKDRYRAARRQEEHEKYGIRAEDIINYKTGQQDRCIICRHDFVGYRDRPRSTTYPGLCFSCGDFLSSINDNLYCLKWAETYLADQGLLDTEFPERTKRKSEVKDRTEPDAGNMDDDEYRVYYQQIREKNPVVSDIAEWNDWYSKYQNSTETDKNSIDV